MAGGNIGALYNDSWQKFLSMRHPTTVTPIQQNYQYMPAKDIPQPSMAQIQPRVNPNAYQYASQMMNYANNEKQSAANVGTNNLTNVQKSIFVPQPEAQPTQPTTGAK